MSEPRTEALWTDPAPRTPEGRRLWDHLDAIGPGTPAADRDMGQRICQIEAEAVAAYRAELAAKVRGLPRERVEDGGPAAEYVYVGGWVEVVAVAAVLDLLQEKRG